MHFVSMEVWQGQVTWAEEKRGLPQDRQPPDLIHDIFFRNSIDYVGKVIQIIDHIGHLFV